MARRGVLIKGGAVLEAIGKLRALAVDKTGTITEGKPRVTKVVTVKSTDETEIVRIAAGIDTRGFQNIGPGHHSMSDERPFPRDSRVHHYKWNSVVLDHLSERLAMREKTGYKWNQESERFLAYWQRMRAHRLGRLLVKPPHFSRRTPGAEEFHPAMVRWRGSGKSRTTSPPRQV